MAPVSLCEFPLNTVQCDGVTRGLERVRSLRYFRAFSTLGYINSDDFTLCCSGRHMSHHLRSFPLRQHGGAPAATTKSPTRTYIVRPSDSLSLKPHLDTSRSLYLHHLITYTRPLSTPSSPRHPPLAGSTTGQPEAARKMLPNAFVRNIALLLFMLMASAATMALDVHGPGCKSRIRYLVDAVPLTGPQLLSLVATKLLPTLLVATEQTELLTAPTSLTSALRCVRSILHYDNTVANDAQVSRRSQVLRKGRSGSMGCGLGSHALC